VAGKGISTNNSIPFKTDVVQFFTENFSHQEYAEDLVRQFLEMVLPEMPDVVRTSYFVEKLLAGIGPINWLFEWRKFQDTGDDEAVRVVLTDLFESVCRSPEFNTF
jgi:hypothetical protein